MENLLFVLLEAFFLALLAYPIFGLIQTLDSIYMYCIKGKAARYYRDLEKYALMVLGFALGATVLFTTPIGTNLDDFIPGFPFMYLMLVPIPIAIYKRRISKKEYFEEIEKLIF